MLITFLFTYLPLNFRAREIWFSLSSISTSQWYNFLVLISNSNLWRWNNVRDSIVLFLEIKSRQVVGHPLRSHRLMRKYHSQKRLCEPLLPSTYSKPRFSLKFTDPKALQLFSQRHRKSTTNCENLSTFEKEMIIIFLSS